MNTKYDFTYLPGADDYFGPNLGSATVRTLSRAAFPADCPNLTKLFTQLHFTKEMENEMMGAILDDGTEPEDAAREYLKAHPEVLDAWLAGVTTADGGGWLGGGEGGAGPLSRGGARAPSYAGGRASGRRCRPSPAKFAGSSQASNAARRAGHSLSMTEYQAVSRLRPL